jgi:hypothetical protein
MAVREQTVTDKWAMYNGDCVEVMKEMASRAIHFSLFSPPFC